MPDGSTSSHASAASPPWATASRAATRATPGSERVSSCTSAEPAARVNTRSRFPNGDTDVKSVAATVIVPCPSNATRYSDPRPNVGSGAGGVHSAARAPPPDSATTAAQSAVPLQIEPMPGRTQRSPPGSIVKSGCGLAVLELLAQRLLGELPDRRLRDLVDQLDVVRDPPLGHAAGEELAQLVNRHVTALGDHEAGERA